MSRVEWISSVVAIVGIGSVCGLLLTGTADLTKTPIQANREAAARMVYEDLLKKPLPDEYDLTETEIGDCNSWILSRVTQAGYAADIELAALWRSSSRSVSMRTLRHLETPGIGDFIDSNSSSWMENLDDQSIDVWTNIDNVSGATITTQAIERAAADFFARIGVKCRVSEGETGG